MLRIVFVHMGSAELAEEFFASYWPDALAIGDPKQEIYKAFDVTWGSFLQFLKPGLWKSYFSALHHGVGKPHGNTMRNPGAFLVYDARIRYTQDFEHFGVPVDVSAFRDAAQEVRGAISKDV